MALWRYGTSCPFSLSWVLSGLSSWPTNGRRPGPSHAAVWGLSPGLSQAERGVRVSPPPRPPLALRTAPNTHLSRRGGDPTGVAGPGLQARPPPRRGFSAASPSRFLLLFFISIEWCRCVSSYPLAVGCPSCRFFQKQSFCNNS